MSSLAKKPSVAGGVAGSPARDVGEKKQQEVDPLGVRRILVSPKGGPSVGETSPLASASEASPTASSGHRLAGPGAAHRVGKYRVAREVGTDKFIARAPVTMMPGDIKKRAEDALNTQVRAIVEAHTMKTEVQQVARPERPRCGQGLCSCLTGAALLVIRRTAAYICLPIAGCIGCLLPKRRAQDSINHYTLEVVQTLLIVPADLFKFRAAFRKIDIDSSGTIELDELLHVVRSKRNLITQNLISLTSDPTTGLIGAQHNPNNRERDRLADKGIGGLSQSDPLLRAQLQPLRLNYDAFVQIVATFCTYSRAEILQFTFNAYDVDGNGRLDREEIQGLCHTVCNKDPLFPGNFTDALKRFKLDKAGVIKFEDFIRINNEFPMVIYEAFRLQEALQAMTLGSRRWLANAVDRKQRTDLEAFRAKHNGHLPDLTFGQRMLLMGRKDTRYARYNIEESNGTQKSLTASADASGGPGGKKRSKAVGEPEHTGAGTGAGASSRHLGKAQVSPLPRLAPV